MDRRLRWLGSLLIVLTVGLWVADAAAWIPQSSNGWSALTLKAGIIALAAAVLLRLVAPVVNLRHNGRCAVCGHQTERGHLYCLDHLQETVNATRDLSHTRMATRPRPSR